MTKSVRQVGIHEAKTHLSRLLAEVEGGAVVEIARRGEVVARLVSARPTAPRRLGTDRGAVRIHDDFDAPLPQGIAEAFGE
jgi:prevent-host-death family protein